MKEVDEPLLHWCEVCGVEVYLKPSDAFDAGWDFPPVMGRFGVINPRTCPNCRITETAWWALAMRSTTLEELEEHHRATIERIARERPRR